MTTHTLKRGLAKVAATAVTLVLSLHAILLVVPFSAAKAAGGNLVISEINWAGSSGHANDEWVELYNNTGLPIDFSVTPYDLTLSQTDGTAIGSVAIDGTAPLLLADQTLLIRNAVTPTTLGAALTGNVFVPASPMPVLPDLATVYTLSQAGTEVDAVKSAGSGAPVPFFGQAATATMPGATMERSDVNLPGSDFTNWYTSATIGAGFVNGVDQYGTPGVVGVAVAVPAGLAYTPADSVTLPATAQVSGTAGSAANVLLTINRQGPVPTTSTILTAVSAGAFSQNMTFTPGRYQVSAQAEDLAGNLSMPTMVPVSTGSTEYNYEVLANSSTVAPVTLGASPSVTNQPTVVMNGSVPSGSAYAEVDVLRNGEYWQTVPVNGNTFTATVTLVPNSSNALSFVAVASTGAVSVPVSVTVLHDNIAPVAVVAAKVLVIANPTGTADMLRGQAGAAEAGTFLMAYSDAAATVPLLTTPLTVNADGSFADTSIGDNQYGVVYLRLTDSAGNVSAVTPITNPISFSGSIALTSTSATTSQLILNWTPVANAVNYKLKYRTSNGTYGAPMLLCSTGSSSCVATATLINLNSATDYVIAIDAVDAYGNETPYSEFSLRTASPAVVASTTTDTATPVVTAEATPAPTPTTVRTTPAPTPAPTPEVTSTPTPSPTETGDVKSASDVATTNYTAWIVLGVLVGIAGLASLGYFYWFGGTAGEAALASAEAAQERIKKADASPTTPTPPKKSAPGGKEKRW